MLRLSFLLLTAAAITASAYQIHVEYESKDYGTNFFTTVPPGEDFYYVNQISSGQEGVKNFRIHRISPQQYDKNVALIVGQEISEGSQLAYHDMECIDKICNTIFDKWTLYNAQASKGAVRAYIHSQASQLAIKDTFLFYFTGTVKDGGLLLHNDEVYTTDEFVSDLALFDTNVRIVVIIDADNARDFVPSVLKNERIYIYCDKNIPKKYKEQMSPFTLALDRSFDNVSDGDGNGLLSFNEMYYRARNYLIAIKSKLSPYYGYGEISSPLYWALAPEVGCDGWIRVSKNDFTAWVPAVDSDLELYIEEGSWKGTWENLFTVRKGSLQAKLKDGGPSYPTKFSLEALFPYYDFVSPALYLDRICIPIGRKIKESKSSVTYTIENYEFKTVGKLTINKKTLVGKLTFSEKSFLADAFTFDSNPEEIQVSLRDFSILFHPMVPFQKTYKPGKTFTAKVLKEK